MFLGNGLNQIIFIFVGIPLIALAIAMIKIMLQNSGFIEPKNPSNYSSSPTDLDLAYWSNKRREEKEENDNYDKEIASINEKYARWRDLRENIKK